MIQRPSRHLAAPAAKPSEEDLVLMYFESEEDREHTKNTLPLSETEKAKHKQMLEAGVKQEGLIDRLANDKHQASEKYLANSPKS